MDLNSYVVQFAALSIVITILIQGLRKTGVPDKYSILLSWFFGFVISFGAFSATVPNNGILLNIFYAFINGIGLGAMSNGLYDALVKRNTTE